MRGFVYLNREAGVGFLILLIAMIFSLISYLTPFAYDDLVFMAEWRSINGNSPLNLKSLYEFWSDIRLYDNGRIANTLSPLSTIFSPWKDIFPFATGFIVAGIIALTTFISFSPKKRWTLLNVSLVLTASLFFLPWRNALFVPDYSLNYLWASFITLLLIVLILRNESKGWNAFNFIIVFLLTILAGGWHEGFAASTLCGFLLYTVIRKGHFSIQWYIIGITYFTIAFLFFYCPGLLLRVYDQIGAHPDSLNIYKLIFDFFPIIFFILFLFIGYWIPFFRSEIKKSFNNPIFIIGIGIVVSGTLLSLLFTHQPRSAFWPDLMAIILVLIMLRSVWKSLNESYFSPWITVLLIVTSFIPLGYIIIWQNNLREEYAVIMQKFEKSDSGTVFHDIIRPSSIPLYTLKITNHPIWVTDFQYHAMKEYYEKPYPAVIPGLLENVDPEKEGIKISGNAGALKIDNYIILPYVNIPESKVIEMNVGLKDGENKVTTVVGIPYASPNEKKYTYLWIDGIPNNEIVYLSF